MRIAKLIVQGTFAWLLAAVRFVQRRMSTAIADAQPQNKLQEQATSKKDLSYSYWAGQTAPTQAPPPKELTAEELKEQTLQRNNSVGGASAWNHAGTFEERCVTEWAKERVKALLPGQKNGSVSVTEVSSIKGDANIWHVRGKKRCGFDLELSLAWTSELTGADGKPIKGTCSVPNAVVDDLDDLDLQVSVDGGTGSAAAQQARKDALGLRGVLRTQLEALLEEMRAK